MRRQLFRCNVQTGLAGSNSQLTLRKLVLPHREHTMLYSSHVRRHRLDTAVYSQAGRCCPQGREMHAALQCWDRSYGRFMSLTGSRMRERRVGHGDTAVPCHDAVRFLILLKSIYSNKITSRPALDEHPAEIEESMTIFSYTLFRWKCWSEIRPQTKRQVQSFNRHTDWHKAWGIRRKEEFWKSTPMIKCNAWNSMTLL